MMFGAFKTRVEEQRFKRNSDGTNGFSLLEVMVALALLAISFTALMLVQGRATKLAIEARNISTATQLARLQLLECKREVRKVISSVSNYDSEGDFKDLGFEGFTWECHAPKFNMRTPSASQLEQSFKKTAKESAKKDVGTTSTVSAPFITMITDALGDSVRELAVIIRWGGDEAKDELRVVTHVIDLTAMAGLSRMLSQGAKSLEKNTGAKKPEESKPGEGPGPGGPPGPRGNMPPGMAPPGMPQSMPPGISHGTPPFAPRRGP